MSSARKLELLSALSKNFDARIAAIKTSKRKDGSSATAEDVAKAEMMKESFMQVARSQPDEAFDQWRDVNAVLVALKPLVKVS